MRQAEQLLQAPAKEAGTTYRTGAIKVAVVYEKFEAGIRAKELSDWLASQADPPFPIESTLWCFDVLSHPQMRDFAAADVLAADLVILSAVGGKPLPEQVRSWMELWLPEKRGGFTAMVLLLDRHEAALDQSASARTFLQLAAEEAGMDFFCSSDEWPQSG